ncbi:MAG: S49 family peptidase [Alphaproteobacteria bacterium]
MIGFLKNSRAGRFFKRKPLVPVVRMTGVIGAVTPLRPGLTLAGVADPLERAFSLAKEAVAIQINSPGGSAVQSRLIFQRIRDLARENEVRVYTFAEDVAASGGYMIACAGDEIYADPSSVVGSIGVLYTGFGFDKLIGKLGIERRVHTAGERKMSLDAFQPENSDDIDRLKNIQRIIHQEFIDLVVNSRGQKIEDHKVDGLTDVRAKMRELYGDDVRLKLVSTERGLLRRRTPGVALGLDALTGGAGMSGLTEEAISAIEARALWNRFGF